MINDILTQGVAELQLSLSLRQQTLLVSFLELIDKWNKVHNLTAIKNKEEMVTHHLLDSLAVNKFISSKKVLDVGTGAGLPGIPLAICNPNLQFFLLDSKQKRINFLHHVITSLELNNVLLVENRVEDYQPDFQFEQIICRAFSSLEEFVAKAGHLCEGQGELIAMKGVKDKVMQETVPEPFYKASTHAIQVPGLQAQRTVVICKQKS